MSLAAFINWNVRVSAEDNAAANDINAALAAVRRLAPIIAKREAERIAKAKADEDSPWYPCDAINTAIANAEEAIYELSQAYADAYAAAMPEPDVDTAQPKSS